MKFADWCKVIGASIEIDGQKWDIGSSPNNYINIHLTKDFKKARTSGEDNFSFGRSEGNDATIVDAINDLIYKFRGKTITFQRGFTNPNAETFYFPMDIEDVE